MDPHKRLVLAAHRHRKYVRRGWTLGLVYLPGAVCAAAEWLLRPQNPHLRGLSCCGLVFFKHENRLLQNLEYVTSLRGTDASGVIGESCMVSDLR